MCKFVNDVSLSKMNQYFEFRYFREKKKSITFISILSQKISHHLTMDVEDFPLPWLVYQDQIPTLALKSLQMLVRLPLSIHTSLLKHLSAPTVLILKCASIHLETELIVLFYFGIWQERFTLIGLSN